MATVQELVEKTGISAETAEIIVKAEESGDLLFLEIPELRNNPLPCGWDCCGFSHYSVKGPSGEVDL